MADTDTNKYQEIIDKLPKPFDLEEQYLYSVACTVAQVPYEIPFKNPFWRKEQYLKALWEIATEKVIEPNIPDNDSVTSEQLRAGSVITSKVADRAITEIKLAQDIVNRLLANNAITTAMLQNLCVTTDKIAGSSITSEKLSSDIKISLLPENHTGIIKQNAIAPISESGDMLTLDIVKNKINEILSVLNSAEITR